LTAGDGCAVALRIAGAPCPAWAAWAAVVSGLARLAWRAAVTATTAVAAACAVATPSSGSAVAALAGRLAVAAGLACHPGPAGLAEGRAACAGLRAGRSSQVNERRGEHGEPEDKVTTRHGWPPALQTANAAPWGRLRCIGHVSCFGPAQSLGRSALVRFIAGVEQACR